MNHSIFVNPRRAIQFHLIFIPLFVATNVVIDLAHGVPAVGHALMGVAILSLVAYIHVRLIPRNA